MTIAISRFGGSPPAKLRDEWVSGSRFCVFSGLADHGFLPLLQSVADDTDNRAIGNANLHPDRPNEFAIFYPDDTVSFRGAFTLR
jgi:hypothetical protein